MNELAEEYSDIVTLETPGTSLQGRELTFAKVSTDPENSTRPVILITGGIHAREWIAPAAVLYLLQELVENEDNRYLIEEVDWFILPVLNPDGYQFSHTTVSILLKGLARVSIKIFRLAFGEKPDLKERSVLASMVTEISITSGGPLVPVLLNAQKITEVR